MTRHPVTVGEDCPIGVALARMREAGVRHLVVVDEDRAMGILSNRDYVEVLKDTAARLAPLTAPDALAMLGERRMAPLLDGIRGETGVDRTALAETIVRFARIAADVPELAEIEANPLIASAAGAVAVDGRGSLAPGRPASPASTTSSEHAARR